jgi:hypothetical protein
MGSPVHYYFKTVNKTWFIQEFATKLTFFSSLQETDPDGHSCSQSRRILETYLLSIPLKCCTDGLWRWMECLGISNNRSKFKHNFRIKSSIRQAKITILLLTSLIAT